MNRVAAKIAQEVAVLLEHRGRHAGPREQVAEHHAGRPAAHHAASGGLVGVTGRVDGSLFRRQVGARFCAPAAARRVWRLPSGRRPTNDQRRCLPPRQPIATPLAHATNTATTVRHRIPQRGQHDRGRAQALARHGAVAQGRLQGRRQRRVGGPPFGPADRRAAGQEAGGADRATSSTCARWSASCIAIWRSVRTATSATRRGASR